jgi:hypothetical protein
MPRKRNYPITIWLNEKELILLKDKISKTTYLRSDYIRRCSLDKNITVIPGIRDLIIEFKKIGSNLDKISRLIDKDSGAKIALSEDLKIIKDDLKTTWAKLAAAMKKI